MTAIKRSTTRSRAGLFRKNDIIVSATIINSGAHDAQTFTNAHLADTVALDKPFPAAEIISPLALRAPR